MRKFILKKRFSLPEAIGLIGIAVICVSVVSYAVTVPHTFSSGTTAKSSEVNANFAALVSEVTVLETQVAAQQAEIAALQANSAIQLNPYLTISSATINGLAGPHVIFEGVNLHIRNGSGATTIINGVGNLLVGYNEGPSTLIPGDRGGSHNLIVGTEHKYLSYSGFVAGFMNTLSGNYATVSGGRENTASGIYSSVSGGYDNEAGLEGSSISGGSYGSVSGTYEWATCCYDCTDCP